MTTPKAESDMTEGNTEGKGENQKRGPLPDSVWPTPAPSEGKGAGEAEKIVDALTKPHSEGSRSLMVSYVQRALTAARSEGRAEERNNATSRLRFLEGVELSYKRLLKILTPLAGPGETCAATAQRLVDNVSKAQCVYCGFIGEKTGDAIAEHIATCPAHPIGELARRFDAVIAEERKRVEPVIAALRIATNIVVGCSCNNAARPWGNCPSCEIRKAYADYTGSKADNQTSQGAKP